LTLKASKTRSVSALQTLIGRVAGSNWPNINGMMAGVEEAFLETKSTDARGILVSDKYNKIINSLVCHHSSPQGGSPRSDDATDSIMPITCGTAFSSCFDYFAKFYASYSNQLSFARISALGSMRLIS
jgi:hypothetical protein